MKDHSKFAQAAVAAVALLALGIGSPVSSDEEYSAREASSEGSTLSMNKFWSFETGRVGSYPGKLVCLRCDLKPGPGMMAQCQKESHRHALSMEGDSMIHPLLAGTEEAIRQINSAELHGKEVSVHGKYYPSTAVILSLLLARLPPGVRT